LISRPAESFPAHKTLTGSPNEQFHPPREEEVGRLHCLSQPVALTRAENPDPPETSWWKGAQPVVARTRAISLAVHQSARPGKRLRIEFPIPDPPPIRPSARVCKAWIRLTLGRSSTYKYRPSTVDDPHPPAVVFFGFRVELYCHVPQSEAKLEQLAQN